MEYEPIQTIIYVFNIKNVIINVFMIGFRFLDSIVSNKDMLFTSKICLF